ncbi:hypothetical protein Hanom_Chr03g00242401 [Helianthus anomalus]
MNNNNNNHTFNVINRRIRRRISDATIPLNTPIIRHTNNLLLFFIKFILIL